ncbi:MULTISPECIES: aspartate/glutamate racemase family protein [Brevibacillus]|jgi:Asp/Glu/hydantoin racemase|uniref:aspartate/glutamate racemase family protein n=1 Tax=Brevibacillus TaxID=55080 RepID=UPI0004696462|nr:aspartate/glutamate racemase family protein [Brevibacillus borstelensis]MCC0567365.1 aspartate/glutamate racemase family protein [Brevibacillus borstelensis]MCM3593106.1 aspartate/glutamate racemase family protein [Brevibacillus borstelensis]MCM3623658.1 aspartate/glutamate racemase family protein [Brevibacillus borstelensis]MED1744466.1 aspartate/glutamate racemase family protein [Brevibacillus borstelensis]MED1874382.1 aspartate/glutamate racemase family protein [Brevibacillus borstelensi
MLGIIRVLTLSDPRDVHRHGELIERQYQIPVVSECIWDQPKGIYDQETEDIAVPKIIEVAKRLEAKGCQAIGISCAADPALAEVRQAVRVPVIGAGSAAAHQAMAMSRKAGVLTILDDAPPLVKQILGDAYVGMKRPDGVRTTLDLQTPEGRKNALEAAKWLKEQGAESIVLCCTGFATIGFAKELMERLQLPAMDPIMAIGTTASMFLKKQNSLSPDGAAV